MKQKVIINGYDTIIEIPNGEALSPLTYTGSKEEYTIEYGNGLKEIGGIASITFNDQTEVTTIVELPFETVLDFHATAMDVVGNYGESVHLGISDNTLTIYGRTNQSFTGSFKVKWSAKGVM